MDRGAWHAMVLGVWSSWAHTHACVCVCVCQQILDYINRIKRLMPPRASKTLVIRYLYHVLWEGLSMHKHTARTQIYTCAYTEQYHSLPTVCINPNVFSYVDRSCFLILCKVSRSHLIFQKTSVSSPPLKNILWKYHVWVYQRVWVYAYKSSADN